MLGCFCRGTDFFVSFQSSGNSELIVICFNRSIRAVLHISLIGNQKPILAHKLRFPEKSKRSGTQRTQDFKYVVGLCSGLILLFLMELYSNIWAATMTLITDSSAFFSFT